MLFANQLEGFDLMKVKNIITILFPTLFMTLITVVSFQHMLNYTSLDFKGIFLISLIFLFPILFFIQGITCAITRTNIFLALGVSILDFIILMFVYLNDSAFVYNIIYIVFGIVGYLLTKFSFKNRSSKSN